MIEKIQELYTALDKVAAEYLIYQKRTNVEKIKELLPLIQEIILWGMQENYFDIEMELFAALKNDMLQILQDLLNAMRYDDKVLMHDTTTYGLMPYLKFYIENMMEE